MSLCEEIVQLGTDLAAAQVELQKVTLVYEREKAHVDTLVAMIERYKNTANQIKASSQAGCVVSLVEYAESIERQKSTHIPLLVARQAANKLEMDVKNTKLAVESIDGMLRAKLATQSTNGRLYQFPNRIGEI